MGQQKNHTGWVPLISQICPLIICHQYLSGAGHVTIQVSLHRVPERTSPVLATVTLLQKGKFLSIFVTNSHWHSAGHVTTEIYIHDVPNRTLPLPVTWLRSGTCHVSRRNYARGPEPTSPVFATNTLLHCQSTFCYPGYVTEHVNILSSYKYFQCLQMTGSTRTWKGLT